MKKFFAIAAIAGTLVACGNASENAATVDTTEVAPIDTTTVAVDSAAISVDSAAATTDSAAAQ